MRSVDDRLQQLEAHYGTRQLRIVTALNAEELRAALDEERSAYPECDFLAVVTGVPEGRYMPWSTSSTNRA